MCLNRRHKVASKSSFGECLARRKLEVFLLRKTLTVSVSPLQIKGTLNKDLLSWNDTPVSKQKFRKCWLECIIQVELVVIFEDQFSIPRYSKSLFYYLNFERSFVSLSHGTELKQSMGFIRWWVVIFIANYKTEALG